MHRTDLKLLDFLLHFDNTLEKFFIDWKYRVPQKVVSIIINESSFVNNDKNREIISKYKKLGIINFNYENDVEGIWKYI